jgi:neuropilin 2
LQTVNISDPAATKLTLKDLEALSRYRFYLRSCTTVGCGHTVTEDSTTTAKEREYFFIIYRPLSTG